jgi:hypothetical protein
MVGRAANAARYSATNPSRHTRRAESICASRLDPVASAISRRQVPANAGFRSSAPGPGGRPSAR